MFQTVPGGFCGRRTPSLYPLSGRGGLLTEKKKKTQDTAPLIFGLFYLGYVVLITIFVSSVLKVTVLVLSDYGR